MDQVKHFRAAVTIEDMTPVRDFPKGYSHVHLCATSGTDPDGHTRWRALASVAGNAIAIGTDIWNRPRVKVAKILDGMTIACVELDCDVVLDWRGKRIPQEHDKALTAALVEAGGA